jgi:class 3 adenylate cyclase
MAETRIAQPSAHPGRMKLEPYSAEIRLAHLTLGIDNIHYDVFLSPKFVEFTRKYLLDLLRQVINVSLLYGREQERGRDRDRRQHGAPEHSAFRKLLSEILQESLTRAKFQQSIECDILHRLALLKFFMFEISNQFSSILVECKEWIRSRGELFEHSEQAHVLRSKIADVQADRKSVLRQVGETVCRVWCDVEEGALSKARRALFGDDFRETYDILQNRFLFIESGNDDQFLVEHYVLMGNFINDPDRFEVFDALLLDFVRDYVLLGDDDEELAKARKTHERLLEQARLLRSEMARLEEEREEAAGRASDAEHGFPSLFKRRTLAASSRHEMEGLRRRMASLEMNLRELDPQIESAKQRMDFLADELKNRIGDYLNQPANAARIFDAQAAEHDADDVVAPPEVRAHLLEEWTHRLEERDLLFHVLAGYELRRIASEYCPPVHLQQLKKALVYREEAKRVGQILEKFPARNVSMKKLDESSRAIRRRTVPETLSIGLRFAEDLMRLRRDRRNYQQVAAWMERINLVTSERARELSRANKSLYEFLHPDESRPADDPVINHVVIKADVRGSTGITRDLLARGMNPASHFSMNLHEPVKRMLERYGAAKVFIEGDAIILAIYETEATRATQRAVARACVLSREILAVTGAYNARAKTGDLPPLELGVGVAFQDSAPSLWMDADSRIMISRALNLSDRLSSCSKMAKRLFQTNAAPFNVYLLQTLMEDVAADEGEELLVRYNLNGIELNDEGFQKLSSEISLSPMGGNFPLPWGKERVQLYFGQVPLGESLEPIVVRKGFVRQLLPGGKIGAQGTRAYYEVCTDAKLLELARKRFTEVGPKG